MPQNLTTYETAVIGGGPAGATIAILLAQAGRNVILFEKEKEAHHKVCGEFISWEAAYYLNGLGIDLKTLGAQSIQNLRIVNGTQILETELPFPAWSLSRRVLDEALLKKAAMAGVNIKRGRNVTNLSRENDQWMINFKNHETLEAKTVFLATGKHDMRGWSRESPAKLNLIGFKIHFRLTPSQSQELRGHVEVIFFDGGYAGLEAVEDEKANLCFLINKDIYIKCGKSWPDILSWLKSKEPHFAARLHDAIPAWQQPLAVYNIPYGYIYRQKNDQPRLFRLGDQMAVIPSFAGDGMSIALHSAFSASSSYLSCNEAKLYHKGAHHDFRRPIRNAQIIARLTSHTTSRRAVFWLLKKFPNLLLPTLHGTRLTLSV